MPETADGGWILDDSWDEPGYGNAVTTKVKEPKRTAKEPAPSDADAGDDKNP